MKTSIKILATMLVAATFAFASCTEKEDVKPTGNERPVNDTTGHENPPVEEPVENILDGTAWVCHMEHTYYYDNIRMDISYDASLDFIDSLNGELFHEFDVVVPIYPAANQHEDMTEEFTYKYYGDSCVLTMPYVDDETGETGYYTYTLIYDKDANTLTLCMDDEDMSAIMGTDIMVFTPRDIPAKSHGSSHPARSKIAWGKLGDLMLLSTVLESLSR